jgi:hypothetical protein
VDRSRYAPGTAHADPARQTLEEELATAKAYAEQADEALRSAKLELSYAQVSGACSCFATRG